MSIYILQIFFLLNPNQKHVQEVRNRARFVRVFSFLLFPMDCFLVCGVSRQAMRIQADNNKRKVRKVVRDGIVVHEMPTTTKGKKWQRRRRRAGDNERETAAEETSRLQRTDGGRVESGGWLAAWLEEAEMKELEKAHAKGVENLRG